MLAADRRVDPVLLLAGLSLVLFIREREGEEEMKVEGG
jgi:hypothetical protein